MEKIDFEEVWRKFQDHFRIDPISHCDVLEKDFSELHFVEETAYISKDLLDKETYERELAEIVKKMWGSLAVAIWFLNVNDLRKRRYFVLKVQVEPRFVRILSNLNRDLRKFKNGAYHEITLDIQVV